MSLVSLVIVLLVVGAILWLIRRAPFIDGTMKQIIFWTVIVVVVLWLLGEFGLLAGISSIRIG